MALFYPKVISKETWVWGILGGGGDFSDKGPLWTFLTILFYGNLSQNPEFVCLEVQI